MPLVAIGMIACVVSLPHVIFEFAHCHQHGQEHGLRLINDHGMDHGMDPWAHEVGQFEFGLARVENNLRLGAT